MLPIGPDRRGRVAVDVRGQRLVFTATPFNPHDDSTYDIGSEVVIVEIENGAAKVAPLT